MKFKYVICKKCNWVHFAVTRKYAENEVKRFNEYFESLSKKEQKDYYGGKGSSIKSYEYCIFCGGSYINFRLAKNKEIPSGSTVSPIIYESKKVKKK